MMVGRFVASALAIVGAGGWLWSSPNGARLLALIGLPGTVDDLRGWYSLVPGGAQMTAWAFLTLGFFGVSYLLWGRWWSRLLPLTRSGDDRIPLVQFRDDLARDKFGWKITGQNDLEVIDLMESLRQAAADGLIVLWGRRARFDSDDLVAREPLLRIPAEYWSDYQFEWGAFISATSDENEKVGTENLMARFRSGRDDNRYVDLHIDRRAGVRWLSSGALKYKGQADRVEQERRRRYR